MELGLAFAAHKTTASTESSRISPRLLSRKISPIISLLCRTYWTDAILKRQWFPYYRPTLELCFYGLPLNSCTTEKHPSSTVHAWPRPHCLTRDDLWQLCLMSALIYINEDNFWSHKVVHTAMMAQHKWLYCVRDRGMNMYTTGGLSIFVMHL